MGKQRKTLSLSAAASEVGARRERIPLSQHCEALGMSYFNWLQKERFRTKVSYGFIFKWMKDHATPDNPLPNGLNANVIKKMLGVRDSYCNLDFLEAVIKAYRAQPDRIFLDYYKYNKDSLTVREQLIAAVEKYGKGPSIIINGMREQGLIDDYPKITHDDLKQYLSSPKIKTIDEKLFLIIILFLETPYKDDRIKLDQIDRNLDGLTPRQYLKQLQRETNRRSTSIMIYMAENHLLLKGLNRGLIHHWEKKDSNVETANSVLFKAVIAAYKQLAKEQKVDNCLTAAADIGMDPKSRPAQTRRAPRDKHAKGPT
jgi:hypothetical protein